MSLRFIARMLLPPIALGPLRRVARAIRPPEHGLRFATSGWRAAVPPECSLDSPEFIAREIAEWGPFASRELGSRPFLFQGPDWRGSPAQSIVEHNQWLSYAYAFALAAHRRRTLAVLDYGGHLGYCYRIARAALPGVALEYHCKELPGMATEGRRLNPEVTWHEDDSCLEARYDLVIMSGVLQYVAEWKALVRRAARAGKGYLFMTGVSAVDGVPGYVAVHRLAGAVAHYQVLNRGELLATITSEGLAVLREFVVDEHPRIDGAPAQPAYRGWLFRRASAP